MRRGGGEENEEDEAMTRTEATKTRKERGEGRRLGGR